MAPTKEELDGALSEIKIILANRESMIAKAYANHPDPNAWTVHFINCLSMIVQGPLSKVEDSGEPGSLTKAAKRRRVDDGEIFQGIIDCGRVLESVEDTTYKFKGPAKFRVETEGRKTGWTELFVTGQTEVYVEDAIEVEVDEKSVPEKFTFAKTLTMNGQEAKKKPAINSETRLKVPALKILSSSKSESEVPNPSQIQTSSRMLGTL